VTNTMNKMTTKEKDGKATAPEPVYAFASSTSVNDRMWLSWQGILAFELAVVHKIL